VSENFVPSDDPALKDIRPKLEEALQEKNLKWDDISAIILRADSEALQEAAQNPKGFIQKRLWAVMKKADRKSIIDKLRPELEPLLVKKTLPWEVVRPAIMRAVGHSPGLSELTAAMQNTDKFVNDWLWAAIKPHKVKEMIYRLRPHLEPILDTTCEPSRISWEDALPLIIMFTEHRRRARTESGDPWEDGRGRRGKNPLQNLLKNWKSGAKELRNIVMKPADPAAQEAKELSQLIFERDKRIKSEEWGVAIEELRGCLEGVLGRRGVKWEDVLPIVTDSLVKELGGKDRWRSAKDLQDAVNKANKRPKDVIKEWLWNDWDDWDDWGKESKKLEKIASRWSAKLTWKHSLPLIESIYNLKGGPKNLEEAVKNPDTFLQTRLLSVSGYDGLESAMKNLRVKLEPNLVSKGVSWEDIQPIIMEQASSLEDLKFEEKMDPVALMEKWFWTDWSDIEASDEVVQTIKSLRAKLEKHLKGMGRWEDLHERIWKDAREHVFPAIMRTKSWKELREAEKNPEQFIAERLWAFVGDSLKREVCNRADKMAAVIESISPHSAKADEMCQFVQRRMLKEWEYDSDSSEYGSEALVLALLYPYMDEKLPKEELAKQLYFFDWFCGRNISAQLPQHLVLTELGAPFVLAGVACGHTPKGGFDESTLVHLMPTVEDHRSDKTQRLGDYLNCSNIFTDVETYMTRTELPDNAKNSYGRQNNIDAGASTDTSSSTQDDGGDIEAPLSYGVSKSSTNTFRTPLDLQTCGGVGSTNRPQNWAVHNSKSGEVGGVIPESEIESQLPGQTMSRAMQNA
jgi:hypothetical protein